jgi:putative transposase
MRKPSKTDLTDYPWNNVTPFLPPATPGGRPREVNLRAVLNTLLDPARTDCPWELLPHERLSESTVSRAQGRDDGTWQRIVDALRGTVRTAAGRESTPRVGDLDSPTFKVTEVGGLGATTAARRPAGGSSPGWSTRWG